MKPEFIDNREARSLAQALRDLCADPSCAHAPLDIATAYFNLGAFQQLADVLESRPGVRLLLGAEPLSPLDGASSNGGGSRPLGAGVRQGLEGLERQLATDRDALPFSVRTARDVCRLAAFLRRETVSVRRFADKFLHGKAYLFRGQGVIAGSANFTQAGLLSNLELALGHYQPSVIAEAERWFDDLFGDAEDYRERLIEILTARETQTWTPHDVFLRALLELYEDELDLLRDDESFAPGHPGGVSLADFQRHGVQRALRALDRFDGVIVGDGVGLGKSFIGSALLKRFVNEEGQRALVLVPAALRDSFWARHMIEEGIAAEVLSYQELASERQLGGEVARLKLPKDAYRFVLVDEAHAFRNPDTEQYRALSRLMGGTRKKLALLTATPVNNSVFDLYHQIMLFARHNARFAGVGIPNLTEYFKRAIEAAGHGESSTAMFGLMDAISVRRTRRFIQEHYPNARVAGKPISFPEPELQTVRYDLDGAYPGLFAQVEPEMDALTLARYQPDNYRIDGDADLRAQALAGLLRTGLLKRFESSVHAFRLTTRTMIGAHEAFLTALDERETVLTPGAQLGVGDEGVDPAAVVEGGRAVGRPAAEYRRDELRRDVEADLERLRGLAAAVAGATIDNDPKLDELARLLNGGLGEEKVIVFSYYADTIDWIERALTADANGERFGRRRFVSVTGTSTDTVAQRLEKVREFSPETMADEAGEGIVAPEDEKGVLLATDVLAEGQNLQQARYIVNYDMPWNPMRLVQRNGRIDRLGSPFATIKLVNLFPEGELDGILKLYETLLRKIGHANVSVGMESPVFEDVAAVDRNFGATAAAIRSIADEETRVLEEEEARLDAFSGEEFRMELRQALARDRLDELRAMPHGAGSGFRDQRMPAGTRGVVFVTRLLVSADGRPGPTDQRAWRYVDLDGTEPGDGLPETADGAGASAEAETDELEILRRVRCVSGTPRELAGGSAEMLYDLWARVQTEIIEDFNRRLDPAYAAPKIPASHAWALSHLAEQTAELVQAGAPMDTIRDADRALAVDRGPIVQRMLSRQRQQLHDGSISPGDAAQEILKVVEEQGLRPVEEEGDPAVALTPERVRLVCWQLVHNAG